MKRITSCLLFSLFLCVGCTFSAPTAHEMDYASQRPAASSKQEVLKEIKASFSGVKYSGKYWLDECHNTNIADDGIAVSCQMFEGDPNTKTFTLRSAGSYSDFISYCPPSFRSTRQLPLFAYYFFVNGFCFKGDRDNAVRVYGLLQYYCGQ